jgi:hypothetical protein
MAQVEAIEPGSYESLLHYLGEGSRHYKLSLPNVVCRDFRSLTQFINPRMILLFLRLKSLARHDRYAKRFFKQPSCEWHSLFRICTWDTAHTNRLPPIR